MITSTGAISSTTMIRSLVGMLPSPEVVCGLNFLRSLMTRGVDMIMGAMDGMLL